MLNMSLSAKNGWFKTNFSEENGIPTLPQPRYPVENAAPKAKRWKLFSVTGGSESPNGFTANGWMGAAINKRVALREARAEFERQSPDNWGFKLKAVEVEQRLIDLVTGGAK